MTKDEVRQKKGLTLQEVSDNAEISKGLLSKIENGRTVPSLPVLFSIMSTFQMKPDEFFSGIELLNPQKYIHIKAAEMSGIEKEGFAGYKYSFILSKNFSDTMAEFVLLEINPLTDRQTVVTDAYEFKYMIQGEVEYEIDGECFDFACGDALFFNGRIPHVPRNKSAKVARMLVVYYYNNEKKS